MSCYVDIGGEEVLGKFILEDDISLRSSEHDSNRKIVDELICNLVVFLEVLAITPKLLVAELVGGNDDDAHDLVEDDDTDADGNLVGTSWKSICTCSQRQRTTCRR